MRSVPMQQEERHLGGDSGCGRASARDYLQSVLDELDKNVKEKKELEASLLEAIRCPEVVADAAFWAERRRKILEKHPELI